MGDGTNVGVAQEHLGATRGSVPERAGGRDTRHDSSSKSTGPGERAYLGACYWLRGIQKVVYLERFASLRWLQ